MICIEFSGYDLVFGSCLLISYKTQGGILFCVGCVGSCFCLCPHWTSRKGINTYKTSFSLSA